MGLCCLGHEEAGNVLVGEEGAYKISEKSTIVSLV
jgi:hypothetical protein